MKKTAVLIYNQFCNFEIAPALGIKTMGGSKHFSPFDIEMMKDDAEMMADVHRRCIFSLDCVILARGE